MLGLAPPKFFWDFWKKFNFPTPLRRLISVGVPVAGTLPVVGREGRTSETVQHQ